MIALTHSKTSNQQSTLDIIYKKEKEAEYGVLAVRNRDTTGRRKS